MTHRSALKNIARVCVCVCYSAGVDKGALGGDDGGRMQRGYHTARGLPHWRTILVCDSYSAGADKKTVELPRSYYME